MRLDYGRTGSAAKISNSSWSSEMAGEDCCHSVLRFGTGGSASLERTLDTAACIEAFMCADAFQLRTASVASPLLYGEGFVQICNGDVTELDLPS